MSASTVSRIPTGTLRFARDTPYQRTAVVLKDQTILQVKNVEDSKDARKHFNSVEDWLLNIEDNTRCEYLDQTLNVENLNQKIDEYVSLDDFDEECDSCCSDSEADSECSWDSEAEDDEEDDNESVENLDYNRNTRTRSAKPTAAKTSKPVERKVTQVRRSGRLANKPRVDYCEIADEFPNAYIGKTRAEQIRSLKAEKAANVSPINQKHIDRLKSSVDSLQEAYNKRQVAKPENRWFACVKAVRDEMKANGTFTTYKALMLEAVNRLRAERENAKAAHTNTTTNTNSSKAQNPFMRVYMDVLREARASGKKVNFQAIADEARTRYEASKKRA